jgi:hypothetical protein
MAKKKNSRSDEPVKTPATPRLRTTKRPAAVPPPDITAGVDGPLAHEPLSLADDLSRERAEPEPTYDQIAEAAYHRYLQRGGNHGQDFDDWVEAERSLRKPK